MFASFDLGPIVELDIISSYGILSINFKQIGPKKHCRCGTFHETLHLVSQTESLIMTCSNFFEIVNY